MKQYIVLLKEIFIYGIIGVISSGTDALLFHWLVYSLNLFSLFSNIFSTVAGIVLSFILNLTLNFKVKDHILKRFLSFFSIGIFGLLISTAILILGEYQNRNIFLTKLAAIVVVAAIQFVLNKFISFRKTACVNILNDTNYITKGEFEMENLYIIIPAYNEEENIKQVIDDWYPIAEAYNGGGGGVRTQLHD